MVVAWITAHLVEIVVAVILAAIGYRHRDEIKAHLPWGKGDDEGATVEGASDGSKLAKIAANMFGALRELRKDLKLSPPGRAILVDGLIFYEHPINLYPDGPEKTAALAGRKAMLALFSSAPPEVKKVVPPPPPPAPPVPEPPAVT